MSICHMISNYIIQNISYIFLSVCFCVCVSVITIQREPVSAVSSDINFPTKGRRGMKDWARSAEDKLFIPKEVFTLSSDGEWEISGLFCLVEPCCNISFTPRDLQKRTRCGQTVVLNTDWASDSRCQKHVPHLLSFQLV